MKTKNKVLLLVLCAVFLVSVSVAGTYAYLMSTTDTVQNTFTVGEVELGNGDLEKGLDEAQVNVYGEPIVIDDEGNQTVTELDDAPRVQANTYKLIPGHTYTKDPTVHVKKDSEDSYIFVKVVNGITEIEAASETGENTYKNITGQILANGWLTLKDDNDNEVTNVYWKKWSAPETSDGTDADVTDDLIIFGEFKIEGGVEADSLSGYAGKTIDITAYAIQADGFDETDETSDDAAGAWKAWVAGEFANAAQGGAGSGDGSTGTDSGETGNESQEPVTP